MEYIDRTANNNLSWTSKYCPDTIDKIIGQDEAINKLCTWLINFDATKKKLMATENFVNRKRRRKKKIIDIEDNDDNEDTEDKIPEGYSNMKTNKGPYSCAIISGNHGVGKTCIVNAIIHTMKYKKQTINFSKIKKASDITDAIDNIFKNSNILTLMDGKHNNRTVLVIDETESILCPRDKACILSLIKNNLFQWVCPMIFISDGQHTKLLSEIKKNSMEIVIEPPLISDMIILIKRISKEEKINIQDIDNPKPNTVINSIIDHSQSDYRRLILTLHDLKYTYNNNSITQYMIDEYLKLSKKKDEDYKLFKATDDLLQKYSSVDNIVRLYETDKSILPLMMQQNYLECIETKTTNKDMQMKLASRISGLLSEGDVIENYIFGEQNWDISDMHCYYTCIAPSYMLSKNLPKDKYIKMIYPQDLNKESLSKINRRNIIKNNNKVFNNKNINDYIYIIQIMKHKIAENKVEECINMLKDYDMTLKNIESLLKIDKIKTTKHNLTGKQKKEISTFLQKE